MKNLNKNFFALSMLLCLGITTQAWGGVATSGTCGTNCNWVFENGTLKITGGTDGTVGTMTDFAKKENQPWYNDSNFRKSITSIEVSGVNNIGNNAFNGLEKATTVNISNGVTAIGTNAFYNGKAIENLNLPDTLKTIGDSAFKNTEVLKDIYLPDGLTKIGKNAFEASGITSLSIPDSVTSLGTNFLKGTSSLEELIIPDGISTETDTFKDFSTTTQVICQGQTQGCIDYGGKNNNIPSDNVKPASELQCYGDKHYWNGTNCVNEQDKAKRTCSSSYKMNDGLCDRIRYTPAEAAKVVTNDNKNSVTITFKK